MESQDGHGNDRDGRISIVIPICVIDTSSMAQGELRESRLAAAFDYVRDLVSRSTPLVLRVRSDSAAAASPEKAASAGLPALEEADAGEVVIHLSDDLNGVIHLTVGEVRARPDGTIAVNPSQAVIVVTPNDVMLRGSVDWILSREEILGLDRFNAIELPNRSPAWGLLQHLADVTSNNSQSDPGISELAQVADPYFIRASLLAASSGRRTSYTSVLVALLAAFAVTCAAIEAVLAHSHWWTIGEIAALGFAGWFVYRSNRRAVTEVWRDGSRLASEVESTTRAALAGIDLSTLVVSPLDWVDIAANQCRRELNVASARLPFDLDKRRAAVQSEVRNRTNYARKVASRSRRAVTRYTLLSTVAVVTVIGVAIAHLFAHSDSLGNKLAFVAIDIPAWVTALTAVHESREHQRSVALSEQIERRYNIAGEALANARNRTELSEATMAVLRVDQSYEDSSDLLMAGRELRWSA